MQGIGAETRLAKAVSTVAKSVRIDVGRARDLALALVAPAALFLAWWQLTTRGLVAPQVLPTPSRVVRAWHIWITGPRSGIAWYSGTWLHFIRLSAQRVAVGFALALGVGFTCGCLLGWYTLARKMLDPFFQWLRPIPVIAWMPFVTLSFGIGQTSAVVLIALGAFFPVLLNTAAGVKGTREVLVRAALMLGTPSRRVLWKVAIPSALPSVVTGVRLALGISWVLVIIAEFVGVNGGLGYTLWTAFQYSRQDLVLADVITLGLLGLITDWLVVRLAHATIHWSKQF